MTLVNRKFNPVYWDDTSQHQTFYELHTDAVVMGSDSQWYKQNAAKPTAVDVTVDPISQDGVSLTNDWILVSRDHIFDPTATYTDGEIVHADFHSTGAWRTWRWDANRSRSDADYGTVFDTSVAATAAAQGTGTGNGVWVLQSEAYKTPELYDYDPSPFREPQILADDINIYHESVATTADRDLLQGTNTSLVKTYVFVTATSTYHEWTTGGWADTGNATVDPTPARPQIDPTTAVSGRINWPLQRGRQQYHIEEDFGVVRNENGADHRRRMQIAVDRMPIGGELFFPEGNYFTDGIVQRREFSILGSGRVDITATAVGVNGWTMAITEGVGSDIQNLTMKNVSVRALSGLHGLYVNVVDGSGTLPMIDCEFSNCRFTGNEAAGGRSVFVDGRFMRFANFERNQLSNGISLIGCADGNRITKNNISGVGTGVLLDIFQGAFKTLVQGNAITSENGSVFIIDGSQIDIVENQIEQELGTTNTSTLLDGTTALGSHIAVFGATRRCETVRILGNNFGAGAACPFSVYVDNANDTIIDSANSFNTPGNGVFDVQTTAQAKNTVVTGQNSARTGLAERNTGQRYPVDVDDSGAGTIGVRKPIINHQNGWSGGEVLKNPDGSVEIVGVLSGGTLAQNDIIGELPTGFWPDGFMEIVVPTFSGPGTVKLRSNNGQIWVDSLPSNNRVGLGARFSSARAS